MPTPGPLSNLTPACQAPMERAGYVLLALPLVGAVGGFLALRRLFPLSGLIGAAAGMFLVPRFLSKPIAGAITPASCQSEVEANIGDGDGGSGGGTGPKMNPVVACAAGMASTTVSGAITGAAGGPVGAAIGAMVGFVVGGINPRCQVHHVREATAVRTATVLAERGCIPQRPCDPIMRAFRRRHCQERDAMNALCH